MKECDVRFIKAFDRAYGELLKEWEEGSDWMWPFTLNLVMYNIISKLLLAIEPYCYNVSELELCRDYVNGVPGSKECLYVSRLDMELKFCRAVKDRIKELIDKRKTAEEAERKLAEDKIMKADIEKFKKKFLKLIDIEKFKKKFLKLIDMSILDTYISDEHKSQCIDAGVDSLFEGVYTAEHLKACKSYAWDEWGEERKPENLNRMQHHMRYVTLVKVCDKIDGMIIAAERLQPKPASILGLGSVVTILECEPKPEDTYKPGDRVVFVRNTHCVNETLASCLNNFYIGVLDRYWVEEDTGKQYCSLKKANHVMPDTGLAPVLDKEGVERLIGDERFAECLVPVSKVDWRFGGMLRLCPVDEKHFPKLNSIVAKIAKPEPDAKEALRYSDFTGGSQWALYLMSKLDGSRHLKIAKPEPFNPMEGQVFKSGIGWVPE